VLRCFGGLPDIDDPCPVVGDRFDVGDLTFGNFAWSRAELLHQAIELLSRHTWHV
jgi:hypothetical protein